MLPIGDENRGRGRTPYVTYALIALNLVIFFIELSQVNIEEFLFTYGAIPARISQGEGILTLFSSMFLHGGFAHLLGNMLFLWVFGDNIEDAFGHGVYLLFYFACGIAAALTQIFLAPDSTIPMIGASGAISGILAGYLILFGARRVYVLLGFAVLPVPAYLMIGLWIIMQFLYGATSLTDTAEAGGVAYAAHIGGFFAGILITFGLRNLSRGEAPPTRIESYR